jgi:hypothetical protein
MGEKIKMIAKVDLKVKLAEKIVVKKYKAWFDVVKKWIEKTNDEKFSVTVILYIMSHTITDIIPVAKQKAATLSFQARAGLVKEILGYAVRRDMSQWFDFVSTQIEALENENMILEIAAFITRFKIKPLSSVVRSKLVTIKDPALKRQADHMLSLL